MESSPGYSTVIFHSKSADHLRSIFDSSKKIPELRTTSPETKLFSSSDKHSRSDMNDNFVKEEIAPGMIQYGKKIQKSLLFF